jgi:hypothetical protein
MLRRWHYSLPWQFQFGLFKLSRNTSIRPGIPYPISTDRNGLMQSDTSSYLTKAQGIKRQRWGFAGRHTNRVPACLSRFLAVPAYGESDAGSSGAQSEDNSPKIVPPDRVCRQLRQGPAALHLGTKDRK